MPPARLLLPGACAAATAASQESAAIGEGSIGSEAVATSSKGGAIKSQEQPAWEINKSSDARLHACSCCCVATAAAAAVAAAADSGVAF